MTIIGILTDPATGGTFLSWTLQYLSGEDVVENPVTTLNAHGYKKKPVTCTKDFLQWTSKPVKSKLNVIYMHNFDELDIDKSTKSYHPPTADCIKQLQNITNKIIVVTLHGDQRLFHCRKYRRVIARKLGSKEKYETLDEQHQDYINTFFQDSLKEFNKDIWDYREFLALSYKPFHSSISILPNIDVTRPCYMLDPFEMFANLNVKELFNWLGIKLDSTRLVQWNKVYQQWALLHKDYISFAFDFRLIVYNILHGNMQDLTIYNLDVVQESAILHELIYKYDLNFKNWKLEKFTDTLQLHNLLEPNIHKIKNEENLC